MDGDCLSDLLIPNTDNQLEIWLSTGTPLVTLNSPLSPALPPWKNPPGLEMPVGVGVDLG